MGVMGGKGRPCMTLHDMEQCAPSTGVAVAVATVGAASGALVGLSAAPRALECCHPAVQLASGLALPSGLPTTAAAPVSPVASARLSGRLVRPGVLLRLVDAMVDDVQACEPCGRTLPNRSDPTVEEELLEHRLASALANSPAR